MDTSQGSFTALHEAFDRLADEHAARPAVEDDFGCQWTYQELQKASLHMAWRMMAAVRADAQRGGSQTLPVVAVLMQRSSTWVAACLAVARLGLPMLALSGDLGSEEEVSRNAAALAEHMPRLLVLDRSLSASAAAAPALAAACSGEVGGRSLQLSVIYDDELLVGPAGQSAPEPSFAALCLERDTIWGPRHVDDVLYLVYTGGTTSASKCVAVTHRMALHELEVYPDFAVLRPDDRILHQSSAFWGATSLGLFDLPWACGGCLVLVGGGAGPVEVAKAIEERGITVAGLVPSVLDALEEDRCRSLRTVFTWGEALKPSTIARWASRLALIDLLIASEYWLILYADHRNSARLGKENVDGYQVGFSPVRGARLTLLKPEHDEVVSHLSEEVEDGQVGELYLAGPMVSALGYTDAARNADAFVDMAVGSGGTPLRHFRTRDLARRRPDGSLEYCGRADGFAKVGGKWLDLAAVERSLLAAGCKEAALVWDENAKARHAAVVFATNSGPHHQSLIAQAAQLQALLPRDTFLHLLRELPKNAATGKVNRGALVQYLASARPTKPTDPSGSSAASDILGRSIAWGLRLAACTTDARGAELVPLAFQFAPGLMMGSGKWNQHGLSQLLPEGLAGRVFVWVDWYRSVCSHLSRDQLKALPYIALLLLDPCATGLGGFVKVLTGPVGVLGAAVWLCRRLRPWLRALLSAAGAAHARRRGGKGWLWAFWLGFPFLADHWSGDFWTAWKEGPCERGARKAVQGIRRALRLGQEDSDQAPTERQADFPEFSELLRCSYCWEWLAEAAGSRACWRSQFYCGECTESWQEYKGQGAAEGGPVATPEATPPASPRDTAIMSMSTLPLASGIVPAILSPAEATAEQAVNGQNEAGAVKPFVKAKPIVDVVDFAEYEVRIAWSRIPESHKQMNGSCDAGKAPRLEGLSRVAQVVERCTGISSAAPGGGLLSSLDSLKMILLVSTLRRELGANLATGEVVRCTTVAELEVLVEVCMAASRFTSGTGKGHLSGSERTKAETTDEDAAGSWAIYAIPRFWKAPVGWLIRLDEVPEEAAMRTACRALVRRHPALRAVPYSCPGDEAAAVLCNGGAQTLIVLRALLGIHSDMRDNEAQGVETGGRFCREAGQGLMKAWPRVASSPSSGGPPLCAAGAPEEVAHFEWFRFETEAELRHAAWMRARSRGFKPPASIAVLVLSGGNKAGPTEAASNSEDGSTGLCDDIAYLHVSVNHAVTDAASIMPLVSDLLELHRAAQVLSPTNGTATNGIATNGTAINGTAANGTATNSTAAVGAARLGLEASAEAALAAAELSPAPNGLAISEERLRRTLQPETAAVGSDDRLDLAHCAFAASRRGYDHYVKLLPGAGRVMEAAASVVGIPRDHLLVTALVAAFSQAAGVSEVKLSLIIPNRDGPGQGQAVANLANTRHLSVWTKDRSLFAIALDLSSRLRRREWQLCDLINDDGDRLFINLRAIPDFQGAKPVIEAVDTIRNLTHSVRNIVEMFADQETEETWTMWMGVRNDLDATELSKALKKALWGLAVDPLGQLED
ncbi:unnamed protein product [Polarella glacialis]|uniref:AMP-dependent synthetase/ligase domain-containing protein n=1 Tax=Polarella glacialis TaxID=89957 RepID=A0A813HC08_POLGL|nr:unnamed protein product [Polarella glacialis]